MSRPITVIETAVVMAGRDDTALGTIWDVDSDPLKSNYLAWLLYRDVLENDIDTGALTGIVQAPHRPRPSGSSRP
jgi:hypothetical protein